MFAEVLEKLQTPEPRKKCKIGRWLDTLSENDRKDADAIFTLDIGEMRLTKAINQFISVSRDTVRTHRDLRCGCHR
jgi:hypothetical protein